MQKSQTTLMGTLGVLERNHNRDPQGISEKDHNEDQRHSEEGRDDPRRLREKLQWRTPSISVIDHYGDSKYPREP